MPLAQSAARVIDARLSASRFERALDFVAVACSFGIEAVRPDPTPADLAQLGALLAKRGPRVFHVPIDAREVVLPVVPPSAGNHLMLLRQPIRTLPVAHFGLICCNHYALAATRVRIVRVQPVAGIAPGVRTRQ